ncbi:hypothetical protein, partial [Acinetobacter baumannii]
MTEQKNNQRPEGKNELIEDRPQGENKPNAEVTHQQPKQNHHPQQQQQSRKPKQRRKQQAKQGSDKARRKTTWQKELQCV